MKKSNRLKLYYELFSLISKYPRIMPKGIAEYFHHSGRGKARSTLLHHLENMYEKKISMHPQLALKAYKSTQKTTYLCRKRESRGLYSFCKRIDEDPRITYSLCFSSCDFFLISKTSDLDIAELGLSLVEKSILYTPQYPIPKNWDLSFSESLHEFQKFTHCHENLDRTVYKDPPWDELDWRIFHFMKNNIRMKFTVVARNTGTTSVTVKQRFYKKILPYCIIANYFFPMGFGAHPPLFLRLKTQNEVSIIESLRNLPCTSYVFPLEQSIVLILFCDSNDNVVELLDIMEKKEEKTIIDSYLLYSPIVYTK